MAVMPRSGGDYVFVSRTLHPWIGFAANFNITAWYLLVIAYFGYLLAPFGFSSAFTTLGVADEQHIGSPTWARCSGRSKNWGFAIGAVTLILCRPAHEPEPAARAADLQGAVRHLAGRDRALDHPAADPRPRRLRLGRRPVRWELQRDHRRRPQGGLRGRRRTSASRTRSWRCRSRSRRSATRSSRRTPAARCARRAPAASARCSPRSLISVVLVAILMALASRTFGNDFLGSATFLSNNGDKAYPFGSPSFFFFYVSMLTSSTLLDRADQPLVHRRVHRRAAGDLPDRDAEPVRVVVRPDPARTRSSDVNERTHSPMVANVITLGVDADLPRADRVRLVEVPGDLLHRGSSPSCSPSSSSRLPAIAFPFRRKAIYDGSPIKRSIVGMPVIALVGDRRARRSTRCSSIRWRRTTRSAPTRRTGWVATGIIAAHRASSSTRSRT